MSDTQEPKSPPTSSGSADSSDRTGEINTTSGHEGHSSFETQPPSSKDWREKFRAWLQNEWPQIQERTRTRLHHWGETLAQAAEKWRLREKILRLLPRDVAQSFPQTYDPLALANWAQENLKKRSIASYGKALTLLICAFYLADLTALLVERFIPEPPSVRGARLSSQITERKPPEAFDIITSRNLFDSTNQATGGDPSPTNPEDMGPPVRTSLPFNLIGTLILKDELQSIATIEDKSASLVYPLRIEDEIPSKVRILKIEPGKVTFLNFNSNRHEYVELPEDAIKVPTTLTLGGSKSASAAKGVEQVSPTHFNIAKSTVDKTMADFNKVLTEARAVPNFENGVAAGYKLFQIVPGSIFDALGLKNGDTITAINGQSINDPAKAFEMLNELKSGSRNFEITMKRDGKAQTNNYEIR